MSQIIAKIVISKPKIEVCAVAAAVLFILFWLFAAGMQLFDFNAFKGKMNNQVFPGAVSNVLSYVIPVLEITIAGLLTYTSTRLVAMILTLSLMVVFTLYIGLALLDFFDRMPCNCAGLLGQNSTWAENLIFNLVVVAVAIVGLIFIYKDKERRKKVWMPLYHMPH